MSEFASNRDDDKAVDDGPAVGALLRATRLRIGEDLHDIAAMLHIRYPYLEAIEEGRYKDLPGPTYAVGFVRAYADNLGLDSDEVVRRFKAETSGIDNKAELRFPSPIPEGGVPGGAILFVGAMVAFLAYGGWYLSTSEDAFLAEIVPPLPERLSDKSSADGTTATRPAVNDATQATAAPAVATNDASATSETSQAANSSPQSGSEDRPDDAAATNAAETTAAIAAAPSSADEPDAAESSQDRVPATDVDATVSTPTTEVAATVVRATAEETSPAASETGASAAPSATAGVASSAAARASGNWEFANTGRSPEAAAPQSAETAAGSAAPATAGSSATSATAETSDAPATAETSDASATAETSDASATAETSDASATAETSDAPATAETSDASATAETSDASATAETSDASATADDGVPTPDIAASVGSEESDRQLAAAIANAEVPAETNTEATVDTAVSRIVVQARTASWIQVRDDIANKLLLTRLMRPGDVYRVPDRPGLTLLTGNAGALEILVDGETVPPLGPVGLVRRDVALDADLLRAGSAVRN